jgi:hypothetical protein
MIRTGSKGRVAEWRSRDLLRAGGFTVVRAAGSKGAFDLVAWNANGGFLVQVKWNAWPSPEERAALEKIPVPPGFRKVVHRWNDRTSLPLVRELHMGSPFGLRDLQVDDP